MTINEGSLSNTLIKAPLPNYLGPHISESIFVRRR